MKNPFKDFLYFTRKERRGIIVLMAGIVLVHLSGEFYASRARKRRLTAAEMQWQQNAVKEYEAFLATVRKKEKPRRTSPDYAVYPEKPEVAVTLAPFDPNTADSVAFRHLGLPGWMARNILRYRRKGGKFRRAEDFRKIYGLTEEQYRNLAPYIRISPEEASQQPVASLYLPSTKKDSLYKYPEGTVIDLNSADTIELKKIPGIGSGIARRIVGYRQRLGGFYKVEQLQEIDLDYTRLEAWFDIRPEDIRRIPVNRSGIERLYHHPYIDFYQAKALIEYRKKNGKLRSLKSFVLYEEFTESDLERIGHYISFD